MFYPGYIYHIYNEGNNKQKIFSNHYDYLVFIRKIRKTILPHCDLIAYCLLPDHFQLLLYTDERIASWIKQGGLNMDPLTNGIRKLLSNYARQFNSRNNRTGSLFRQKTKSTCLTELLEEGYEIKYNYKDCFHYIHQLPCLTGLVEKPVDWRYSSCRDYALLRSGTLCNHELAIKFCGYDPSYSMEILQKIMAY